MHFIFRTLLTSLFSRFRPALGTWDVGTTTFRVLPTDLDVLRHMNNGVYLSILDLGRVDLMVRCGLWRTFQQKGWYPVVVSETISFRRSLELWQRFDVETRLLGVDAKAVYAEQRFVVSGEVYARAFIRARFLKRSGGTVSMEELLAVPGVGAVPDDGRMPEWLTSWGEQAQLPPSRAAAPSVWE